MDNTSNNRTQIRPEPGSMTTRRSFVAAASLGAVSLYGLWAGLGAAPLRFWERGEPSGKSMDMAGHGSAQGPMPDEFRQMTEEFLARHLQPDGSILVESERAAQSMAGMTMTSDSQGSTHAMPGMTDESMVHGGEAAPLDVFMLAQQWSFDPPELRLRTGIPYRFKMMAVDAAHGASLQLGPGSHIIRLPKDVLVERQMVFTEPGEYLLYCTMYCGEGHQFMNGKIHVA
jgi:plastocyanin